MNVETKHFTYIMFQRVYDNAIEVAALERAQTIVNIEWKLRAEKRATFLEYISKNFSPKVIFYDDDPTKSDGEIHGLTLMTKRINEQVKSLGSIIVDLKEKENLQKLSNNSLEERLKEQTSTMQDILEKLNDLQAAQTPTIASQFKTLSTAADPLNYQLYFPQSTESDDADTSTSQSQPSDYFTAKRSISFDPSVGSSLDACPEISSSSASRRRQHSSPTAPGTSRIGAAQVRRAASSPNPGSATRRTSQVRRAASSPGSARNARITVRDSLRQRPQTPEEPLITSRRGSRNVPSTSRRNKD